MSKSLASLGGGCYDRALTCSSIPLQWQQHYRNQVIGRQVEGSERNVNQGWRRSTGHLGSNRDGWALRVFLTMCQAFRGGQKQTHLGTILLILRVCVNNGLYLRKLDVRLSKTWSLGLQSVRGDWNSALNGSSSRFSYSASTSFPSCLFPSGSGCVFQLRRSEAIGSSKRVCRSHLTVDDEGIVTMNGVSNDVPWGVERLPARGSLPCLFTPRQSLTLCPPRPMCAIVWASLTWCLFYIVLCVTV